MMTDKAKRPLPSSLIVVIMLFLLFIDFTLVGSQLMASQKIRSSGTINYGISPLHIEGRYIKDTVGNTIVLRGFQKHGFEDDPEGRWQDIDGAGHFNEFDETVVRDNFRFMKSWGANEARIIDRAQYWITNPVGNKGIAHRDAIKRTIEIAREEGLYVNYALFSMDSADGYHDIPWGTTTIPTLDDFVNLWVSIVTELSPYPNVLFELWNEVAGDQGTWFDGVNQTIKGIRNVTDDIIIVQWNWDVWVRYGETAAVQTLGWINDPRIQGTNILYSTHMYSDARGYVRENGTDTYLYEYEDVKQAFLDELVYTAVTEWNKSLYVGEYGPGFPVFQPNELIASENGLKILNEWGINYNVMWWWAGWSFYASENMPYPWAMYLERTPNYEPIEWGLIVKKVLAQVAG